MGTVRQDRHQVFGALRRGLGLDRLDQTDIQIWYYRFVEELTLEEVGAKVGMTGTGVWNRLDKIERAAARQQPRSAHGRITIDFTAPPDPEQVAALANLVNALTVALPGIKSRTTVDDDVPVTVEQLNAAMDTERWT